MSLGASHLHGVWVFKHMGALSGRCPKRSLLHNSSCPGMKSSLEQSKRKMFGLSKDDDMKRSRVERSQELLNTQARPDISCQHMSFLEEGVFGRHK